jgi:hypothetical protein
MPLLVKPRDHPQQLIGKEINGKEKQTMAIDILKKHWLKLLLIPLVIGTFSLTSVALAQEEDEDAQQQDAPLVQEWEQRHFATLEQRQADRARTFEQRCEADQWIMRGGESLGLIVVQCNVSLASILADNPQISDPDQVWVGEVVNVPEEDRFVDLQADLTAQQQEYMMQLAQQFEDEVVPVTGLAEAAIQAERRNFATQDQRRQAEQMTLEQRCEQSHWIFLPGESLGLLTTVCGIPLDVMLAHNHQVGNPHLVFAGEIVTIPDDPFADVQPRLTQEQLEHLQADFDVEPVDDEDDVDTEDEDDEEEDEG